MCVCITVYVYACLHACVCVHGYVFAYVHACVCDKSIQLERKKYFLFR